MTMISILLASLASSVTAAGLTALHFRSRLSEAKASEARYKAWWERDSGKMIVLQAEADLRRQQHIDAGRQSHKAERALFRETARKLGEFIANRDNPPSTSEPVLGFPADLSAGRKPSATGQVYRSAGQDIGRGLPPHVTQRASAGNEPGQSCGRNHAGYCAPAETPTMKGASNG